MGEVLSIHLVRRRDGDAEAVEHAVVQTNYGLQGDWRSRRNRAGQVTLIEAEVLDEVGRLRGSPVLPGASRRQIIVRGLNLNKLIGQRIRIGAVRLFVETPCDPCSRMEETIGAGARQALEGRGGVRCFVLAGGEICVGDPISEDPFLPATTAPSHTPLASPTIPDLHAHKPTPGSERHPASRP
jgi:MOSC domain-containing protein YiiM